MGSFCGVAWLDVEDGRLWQVWQRPRESVVEVDVEAASHTHIRTSVVSAGRDLVCEKRVFSHCLSLYTLSIRAHTLFLAYST